MSDGFHLAAHEALPVPTRATRDAVIRCGERVRGEVGLEHGFQLHELVSANDGEVVRTGALPKEFLSRAFEMPPGGRFRIHVSVLRTGLSNNFVIATQLGHRALHMHPFEAAHPGKTMVVPRQLGDRGEELHRCMWEANWFAQGLLLPEAELMDIVRDRGLKDAAARFGVTQPVVRARVERIEKDTPVETPSPEQI